MVLSFMVQLQPAQDCWGISLAWPHSSARRRVALRSSTAAPIDGKNQRV